MLKLNHFKRRAAQARARQQKEVAARRVGPLLEVLVDLAKYLGAFGVIGLATGMVVVFVFGVNRNALPYFGGDEWLPQLVSVGLLCGVFSMFLVSLPLVDVVARGEIPEHASQWPLGRPPTLVSVQVLGPFFVYLLSGLACVAAISWGVSVGVSIFVPFLVLPLVSAAVDVAILRRVAGITAREPWKSYLPVWTVFALTHLMYLVLLLMLIVLVLQRAPVNEDKLWLTLGTVGFLLAVYRGAAFVVAAVMGRDRSVVVSLVAFVSLIGVIASAEVMQAARLGNMPLTQLRMERSLACTVAQHLQLGEWCGRNCHQDSDAKDSLVLRVDVVSRIGGQQVLAAPGMLRSAPSGKCRRPESSQAARQGADPESVKEFPCVEIPSDAIQAVLR